ncbi:anti-repressor SinI family protein [Virgibacillus ihumii]|nr:anti-repressor SinI family protein [Virgibacillus ihumii]
MQNTVKQVSMDDEWLQLIKSAKTLGLTVDEIRTFLAEMQRKD